MERQDALQYVENVFMVKAEPLLDKFSKVVDKVDNKLIEFKASIIKKIDEVFSKTLSEKGKRLLNCDWIIYRLGPFYPRKFYKIQSDLKTKRDDHIIAVKRKVKFANFELTPDKITAMVLDEIERYEEDVKRAIGRLRRLI